MRNKGKLIGLWGGVVVFLFFLLFVELNPGKPEVTKMAAIALLMAIWWISDAVPLYATALLPVVLYPLLGIMKGGVVAPVYINSTIFLFMGGFMIAVAMEYWDLHRRIALFIINRIGGGADRIVLGFMIAAAFLSMWISNTATAIMMMPIGLAIISQIESRYENKDTKHFSTALMLGIAYSCSIGGVATLVGTPPNLSFSRIFQITFPNAAPITFGSWFIMGLPISIIMLSAIWFVLVKVVFRSPAQLSVDRSVIRNEYQALGKSSYEEKVVLIVFSVTAFLWVFRRPLVIGNFTLPGWSGLLPYPGLIDDGTVALAMALVLFLIPSREGRDRSIMIMPMEVVKKIPWNIILLFGGGFALAKGFQVSGLSEYVGGKFSGLGGVHPLYLILAIVFTITFLTELTSNTATTEMILPILASAAIALNINPLLLMIPATLAASHAFMMPVATPPNAIVFGSERITIANMAKGGFVINLIGITVVTLGFYFIGTAVFGIEPHIFPAWAEIPGN